MGFKDIGLWQEGDWIAAICVGVLMIFSPSGRHRRSQNPNPSAPRRPLHLSRRNVGAFSTTHAALLISI